MYTPEENAFVNAVRAKLAAGYSNKEEEKADLAKAVAILREKRNSAVAAAAKKRKSAAAPSADALLAELDIG